MGIVLGHTGYYCQSSYRGRYTMKIKTQSSNIRPDSTTIKAVRKIHEGKHLSYYEIDYVDLAGNNQVYEMVSKNHDLTIESLGHSSEAVVILLFNSRKDKILLEREYRVPVGSYVYSLVAGEVEPNEQPLEAAIRELREETGLRLIKAFAVLKPSYACAPVTDDRTHLIVGEAEGFIQQSDSPKEEIHAAWYTRQQLREMLEDTNIIFAGRAQAICYAWVNGANFVTMAKLLQP